MNKTDVFINCPFSVDYKPFFWAIVYSVIRCGFEPRCALEVDNAIENRYAKICRIIKDCRYGIHDISYTGLYGDPMADADFPLPRFNMPFELGLFLGAHSFGGRKHAEKATLVLDIKPFRYQKFLSDISGQDIKTYDRTSNDLIRQVTQWLRDSSNAVRPGGQVVAEDFKGFNKALPELCAQPELTPDEITFLDFKRLSVMWIEGAIRKPLDDDLKELFGHE